MTPQEQSISDKLAINIQLVANGYIVGFPGERRVYHTEEEVINDLQAYFIAYRSVRPRKAGTPYCAAMDKKAERETQ